MIVHGHAGKACGQIVGGVDALCPDAEVLHLLERHLSMRIVAYCAEECGLVAEALQICAKVKRPAPPNRSPSGKTSQRTSPITQLTIKCTSIQMLVDAIQTLG